MAVRVGFVVRTKRHCIVVVDTSILFSAALSTAGKPAAAVDDIVARSALVFSRPAFEELATRLHRSKFDRYFAPQGRRLFLETALVAGASCIISGDQDLLVMDPFRAIPILTAAAILRIVGVPGPHS